MNFRYEPLTSTYIRVSDYKGLAEKYVIMAKDYLIGEYGYYCDKTTGMDVDEDTKDDDYRLLLKNEILKDRSVKYCYWQAESYGYTLWIEF